MGKRDDFKKKLGAGIITLGIIGAGGAGLAKYQEKYNDLSEYNANDTKYMDYIKGNKDVKTEMLTNLETSIDDYLELSSKKDLTDVEKAKLDEAVHAIETNMKSGDLAEFYLKDVFKGKIKETYKVDDVVTYWNPQSMSITMYKGEFKKMNMEDEDKIKPIVVAMNDIAKLQGYINRDRISKSDIKDFIRMHENMKAFSNLTFIKKEGQPLYCADIQLENDER